MTSINITYGQRNCTTGNYYTGYWLPTTTKQNTTKWTCNQWTHNIFITHSINLMHLLEKYNDKISKVNIFN